MNFKSQKALIWGALVLIVIYGIGYMMMGFFPPPSPTLDAEHILAIYSDNNLRFRIGVVLLLFSGGFLVPFSVAISAQIAQYETGYPVWATFQLAAGSLASILLWLPAIFWGAAAFSIERDPSLTLMLHELGWLSFITPVVVFPMQLIAVGVICFIKKEEAKYSAFPRWMGYLTFWQAIQAFGGLIAMLFKTGPFAWNGLFAFYLPLTLYFVWTVALAYTMLRAIKHQKMNTESA